MPRSLVLGANGQDGSYLVEALLRREHEVVGVGRDSVSRYARPENAFRYVAVDLASPATLVDLLQSVPFDYIFHFAAVHGSAGFQYEPIWQAMMAVNLTSLQVILEHARTRSSDLRIIYAGSSKVIPAPLSGTIDESVAIRGTCLYSIGKVAARDLLDYYRREHGISTTNLIFFNHESPRRPANFLMPILAHAVASARHDESFKVEVKTLDFWIDWSAADELMEIVADIATSSESAELILASGKTWSGYTAVEALFGANGLDAHRHVFPILPRRDPGPFFQVKIDRLEAAVGRRPLKTILDIAQDIISIPLSDPLKQNQQPN